MVQVTVGDEDLLHPHAGLVDSGHDALEIAARIDDCPGVGAGATKQRTVLPEAGHWDDRYLHR